MPSAVIIQLRRHKKLFEAELHQVKDLNITEADFNIKEWEIPAAKAQPNKPLTIEELRQMNGQPVWCEEINEWGIVKIETVGQWANNIFLIGHYGNEQVRTNFEYDVEMRGLELYRHKPTEGAKKS